MKLLEQLAYEPSETLQQVLDIDFTSLPSSKVMRVKKEARTRSK